jgi:type IV secretory pathway VirB10-like protein
MAIRTKLTPPAGMQLSRTFLLVAGMAVVLGLGGLALLQRAVPSVSTLLARPAPEPVRKVDLPEELKPSPQPYAPPAPKPQPPVAQPVIREAAAAAVTPPPPPSPPAAVAQVSPPQPPPSFLDLWKQQQDAVAQTAQQQQPPRQETPKTKPTREPWIVKPQDITLKTPESKDGKESPAQREELGRTGTAAQLIKPATWAIPKYPLRTLYRSQALPCQLVDPINTDIPGPLRLVLTVPIFDKFHHGYEILPKATEIIAVQEGKLQYGASRATIKLEELQPPTGEVISLKATVGDERGNGLGLEVDNHYGKLLLATGISAILNIGVRAAAGTPSAGNFFQNPAQQAAGDIGQSVQRDAQSVVDRELRVPPTGERAAGTVCSVHVLENITFSRRPVVVR